MHLGQESILEHAEEAFNAPLGLGRESEDGLDGEIFEGLPDLSGALTSSELLLEAPEVVVAAQGGVTVLVDGDWDSVVQHHGVEQSKVGL